MRHRVRLRGGVRIARPGWPAQHAGMHEPYWYPLYEPGPNRLASLNDLYRLTIAVGIAIPPETETAC